MWPFTKSKKQKLREQEIKMLEVVAKDIAKGLSEPCCKKKPHITLCFENGTAKSFYYDSVIKRNKEASHIRKAIQEDHEWLGFQTQNNREVLVDARTLNMVAESDE